QEVSRGCSMLRADDLEPAADLENSRTLGRGAASDSVDAGFVGLGVLAGAFGDVENDGNGGPAQLISQFPLATRQGADDLVGQGYEVHRDLVDIELFVIEAHALHLIGHASGSLQAITMSNHTPTRLDDPGEQCEIKCMRGPDTKQSSMLCLLCPESVGPQDTPMRATKGLVESVLQELSPVFDRMYSPVGRPSIPPERLLKATLLMALYTVRSERQLCEQLDYNLLFKWFLDMDMTEPAFDPTCFGKNRDRLMEHEVAERFFAIVTNQVRKHVLMSSEHFSVDGTLIEAWASIKIFRPKDDDSTD